MTAPMTDDVVLEFAREALRSQHHRPNEGAEIEGEARIVAKHLAVVDGVVRVVDPETRQPREIPSLLTGKPEPVTVKRLLEDMIYYRELPNRSR